MVDDIIVLMQHTGELDLVFTPKETCAGQCLQLNATIEEGDTSNCTFLLPKISF